jgi:hypothetical protein
MTIRPKFVAVMATIGVSITPAFADASMREKFAVRLAAATFAEMHCGMKGELDRAKRDIAMFNSGFDTLHNHDDAALLGPALLGVAAKYDALGQHAWCVEYRAIMAGRPPD